MTSDRDEIETLLAKVRETVQEKHIAQIDIYPEKAAAWLVEKYRSNHRQGAAEAGVKVITSFLSIV